MFWRVKQISGVCLIFSVLVTLSILVISCKSSSPVASPECAFFESLGANSWLQAYETIDQQINGGQGYANHLDTIGFLAWRQSRVLESYLNMYDASNDSVFLEKFICQTDLVLMHRDDYMRGGVPAWSTLKYLKPGAAKRPEALLINNAMILYPLARFAATIIQNEDLSDYHNVALWYLDNVIQTVAWFQTWYMTDGAKGWYVIQTESFVKYPGINVPHNWNAAMGKVLLALYDATGEERYLDQAETLARTFKGELQLAPNGSYRWYYWFGEGFEKYKSTEDVSHGAIDIQFALLCYQHNIVFDQEDMHCFVRTLTEQIWDGHDFRSSVWGTGQVNQTLADAGIFWIDLARIDADVLEIIENYIEGRDFQTLTEYKCVYYMWAISALLVLKGVDQE